MLSLRRKMNIMQHNKHTQELADKCAQVHGYLCANYFGKQNDRLIYEAFHKKKPFKKGPWYPPIIVIDADKMEFMYDDRVDDILGKIRFRPLTKGKNIYNKFVRKLEQNDFSSKAERNYVTQIVNFQQSDMRNMLDEADLFEYLEIAERLDLKLKFVTYVYKDYQGEEKNGIDIKLVK